MDIPPRFGTEQSQGMVCKPKKALYGPKESPRTWFDRFCIGYQQSYVAHTLFITHQKGKLIFLIVYVDDIVMIGNDGGDDPIEKVVGTGI